MKIAPLRWTLGLAATEFGVDRRTLATRAKTSGQVPGEDGKFSTRQIAAIVHGDTAGEKLRKLRAEADLAELERDELTKKVISVEQVSQLGERTIRGIVTIIERSRLAAEDRNDIREEIQAMLNELGQQGCEVPESSAILHDEKPTRT